MRKSIITKKEQGSSTPISFMYTIITVVVVAILVVVFIGYMRNVDIKNDIDVVAREYILRMETTGYLTDEMEKSLEQALLEVGVSNIDLTGTTKSEVGYGEQIVLCISGKVMYRTYSLASIFDLNEEYEWHDFTLTPKSSTAKK